MEEKIKTKGGIPARIGNKFHAEIERIQLERIKKGLSKDRVSTEKLTNLMVRHKEAWNIIANDLITLTKEEIEKLWK